MSTTPPPMQQPMNPQTYLDMVRQNAEMQANTTGLTQMAPNLQPTAPAQRQFQQPGAQETSAVGVGEKGAHQRQSMQNLVKAAQGAANQFGQYVQAKQNREYEQVITRFTGATQGVAQAHAQVLQATQALKANPQDSQAQQMLQTAKDSLQKNQAILNDMANDKKQHKIVTKAFGIDDKNANSPERAAAIKAIQDQSRPQTQQTVGAVQAGGTQIPGHQVTVQGPPGLSPQAAGIQAQIPSTMQLSPEAQAQQMLRQAQVVGKPATEGQLISGMNSADRNAITSHKNDVDAALKSEKMANDVGMKTDQLIATLPARGLKAVKNPDGTYKRDANGNLVTENISLSELKDNPVLADKWQEMQTRMRLQTAQAESTLVRARVAQMAESRKAQQMQQLMQPGVLQNYANAVTDPSTGVSLAQVPAAIRGAVLNAVAQSGRKLSKPLTSDELKRSDLAGNAVDNIQKAQEILQRRPDMFGPAGFGRTKFEMALAGGDPDAIDYMADIRLANLPAVGIHGVRGKWAIEDLSKLDSNLYLNADSMTRVLDDIHRSATEFKSMGGRQVEAAQPTGISEQPKTASGSFDWGKHPIVKQ